MMEVSEIKLSYKNRVPVSDRVSALTSQTAADVIRKMYDYEGESIDHRECFFVLYLNRSNQVLACPLINTGGVSATLVDAKLIFQNALKLNASSMILAHNHPSGKLKPSEADKRLTAKVTEFAKLIDISVLDHIILTEENYYSLADSGDI